MHLSTWLTYVVVALVCTLTPGPGVLFAVSTSIAVGWRRVVFSSLGNITGIFLVSSLSMLGLGVLLKTSTVLFSVIKMIGGAYLIYLGFRQWNSGSKLFLDVDDQPGKERLEKTNAQLFTKGLLVAVTNPKAILFFSALFPQFIKTNYALLPQFMILTVTFMVFSFAALMVYAYMAVHTKTWFKSPNRLTQFNRVTGGLFMMLGIGLLRLKKQ